MPSLREYILDLLQTDEINEWSEITVTSLATGDDASRSIISEELIDEDNDADVTAYGGWYAFDLTTFEQQRVRNSANFTPSTGKLLTNGEFSAPLPVGRKLWLIRRMGIIRQRGMAGLRDVVNSALRDLAFRAEIVLDSNTWQSDGTYDASDYPWLTEDRLIELRQSLTPSAPPWMIPGLPIIRKYGATSFLVPQVRATNGSSFTLVAAQPALSYIKTRRLARATATATAGAITAITPDDTGDGYLAVPSVTITGAGSGATATAVLTGDTVTSYTITAPGSGYVTATTTVTIGEPVGEYAASTIGLMNLDDEAIPPVDDVTPVALYHFFLAIARGPAEDTTYWLTRAERQSIDASFRKWKAMPKRERNDDIQEDTLGSLDENFYSWPD